MKCSPQENLLEYISTEIENPVVLEYIFPKDVLKLIQNLDSKKSCGYDLISNKILKSCCSTIAPYITNLFNMCIKSRLLYMHHLFLSLVQLNTSTYLSLFIS